MSKSTERFSNRVDDYVKYRPLYPAAALDMLITSCHLTPDSTIADIGSGTGILSKLFLDQGYRVFGVEPNADMRHAGEQLLTDYDRFTSVAGTAEATTLADQSVDLIIAGQAFHWFDPHPTRQECARILRPGGWVVLIWNMRKTPGSPFLIEYERLLNTYGTDYQAVNHRQIDSARIEAFFAPSSVTRVVLPNEQQLDFAGLRGRLLSSSYVPAIGQPRADDMLNDLAGIFERHQEHGIVRMIYDTVMYFGQLG